MLEATRYESNTILISPITPCMTFALTLYHAVVLYLLNSLYSKLVLSIAFQCPCLKHTIGEKLNNLCTLVQGQNIKFLCGRSVVMLNKAQKVWLGKVNYNVYSYTYCMCFYFVVG